MTSKIPLRRFSQFHKCFKGDTEETYTICRACGGACEKHKIGALLPGEKEFIAKSLGMLVPDFEARYLDKLITPLGTVDVLKFVQQCPFLNKNFACTIRDVKVILCEIYPIVFSINDDTITFQLDKKCPLINNQNISKYFLEIGVQCFKPLNVPFKWFKIVVLYDEVNFDYERIEKLRKQKQEYESFYLSDIMKFSIK